MISEEAFFTETFLFHTITIDEGHRLKNDAAKLSDSLARVRVPFRLLLTGTPLQNNLNELWALLQYVLPDALGGCKDQFEAACSVADGTLDQVSIITLLIWCAVWCIKRGTLDQRVVSQARDLLESLMIRRVKSEVEKSLKPKLQYVLKAPLPRAAAAVLPCHWLPSAAIPWGFTQSSCCRRRHFLPK